MKRKFDINDIKKQSDEIKEEKSAPALIPKENVKTEEENSVKAENYNRGEEGSLTYEGYKKLLSEKHDKGQETRIYVDKKIADMLKQISQLNNISLQQTLTNVLLDFIKQNEGNIKKDIKEAQNFLKGF